MHDWSRLVSRKRFAYTLCAPSIEMSCTTSALSYLSITESRAEKKNQVVPSAVAFEPESTRFLSILKGLLVLTGINRESIVVHYLDSKIGESWFIDN